MNWTHLFLEYFCFNVLQILSLCILSAILNSPMANSLVLFITVHFVLLLSTSSAEVHNNYTDLSALLAFRASVGDPDRILSTEWTTNTSFCTWTGISCDRTRQRVISLNIVNLPLYGTISPHIANLSFLTYLNLSNNRLRGPIPDSLSQLPHLEILALGNNQLSGSIPPAIFNMTVLTELHLFHNNLSGTLPSNISLNSMLQFLSVSDNQLTGSIPSSLSHFHHLQVLSLSINGFSGRIPPEIGKLQQLRFLALGKNNLTGTIPSSLGNLTQLQTLDIGDNAIHGIIPEEFGGLSNILVLLAAGNFGITGPLPMCLSNISTIEVIDFTDNQLTGPLRVQFESMPDLKTLFLGGNKLTRGMEFLASLSNCRVLRMVEFGGNGLGGFLPNTIGNLSRKLNYFGMNSNHVTGEIPAEIGNLSSLWDLDMGNNELAGIIPSEIGMLENLQSLILNNNRIHGSIPWELGGLKRLGKLSLEANSLSGFTPDSLGNISGLQHLILGANELSARIPETIWSLTGLIELNLSRNFLNGSLPLMMGNIKSLDILDMSVNQLSGNIPSAFKELQMLRYLDLSNNSFDGFIPQSFSELISIEALNLSRNDLSGIIPNSLVNLQYLRSINLSFNKLTGNVPDGGVFSNLTIASLVGNAALCGASRFGFPPCTTNDASPSSATRALLFNYILPAVAITVMSFAFCYMVLIFFFRRQTNNQAPSDTRSLDSHRSISYHELVRATENFSEANLLGRGSFGSVYKGCLDDGLIVAVKVLNLEVHGALRSFDVECHALSMVRHRNLVKIISTCCQLKFRALVLQFMPNGSLERWLYSHNYCLNLLERINIAIDVALALEYLHHHYSQIVLHCDLKPSNILLDKDMTAHVADFGIAKVLVGDSWTVTSTSMPGTIGYMAPEYASTARVSKNADVYSFGILLLEIFTRKRPTDSMFIGELNLRSWVCNASFTNIFKIVDRNLLKDEYGNEKPRKDLILMHACLSSLLELGMICSSDLPKERLEMKQVVPKLEKIKIDYLSMFPII